MMKKIINLTIFSIAVFLFTANTSKSQCLNFAKAEGFAKLDTSVYIPEGRLTQIPLSQGDNIDIYKPFFRGRKYKVVVTGDSLPGVTFTVNNFQRQVLFDSEGKTDFWEFTPDKNQNLIIHIEIPAAENGNPKTSCLAVVVGFKK